MRSKKVRPEAYFDGLFTIGPEVSEIINQDLHNMVRPAVRGCNCGHISEMRKRDIPIATLVRITGGKNDVGTVRSSEPLMNKVAREVAPFLQKTGLPLFGVESYKSDFNRFVIQYSGMNVDQRLIPKWVKVEGKEGMVLPANIVKMHSMNEMSALMRGRIDTSKSMNDYFWRYDPEFNRRFIDFRDAARSGQDIIFIDDSVKTGTTQAMYTELWARLGGDPAKIHHFALINEVKC